MNFFGRKCIIKGAREKKNVGDSLMQSVAKDFITRLGFKRLYLYGHKEAKFARPINKGSIEAIFTLGAIQFTTAWEEPLSARLQRAIVFKNQFKNAKNIYLPSSWGPFDESTHDLLDELTADSIVFGRDTQSVKDINQVLGKTRAHYCPDLAFLYPEESKDSGQQALAQSGLDPLKPILGIIPNARCVQEKVTPLSDSGRYYQYLNNAICWGQEHGFQVVGLSHMVNTSKDAELLKQFQLPVIESDRPHVIRSVLSQFSIAVCSRYHGVVNCLNHGVPVVSLGWHHKYDRLMKDFNLQDYNYSLIEETGLLEDRLERISSSLEQVRNQIVTARDECRLIIHDKLRFAETYINQNR